MTTKQMNERRLSARIRVAEDIFVSINNCLGQVHDISMDGLAFDYPAQLDTAIKRSDTLEIFFMQGTILYIENIPYTIVAKIDLPSPESHAEKGRRRACIRFDALNFRQIITFHHIITKESLFS